MRIHWRESDGVLHLESTRTEHLDTQQYNIGTLIDEGFASETILNTIQVCVAPETWESEGGTGSIILLGDVMFVRQTPQTHLKTAGLLKALQDFGRRTYALSPPLHEEIRNKLSRDVDADFNGSPLSDIVRELGDAATVPIELDVAALQKSGVRAR